MVRKLALLFEKAYSPGFNIALTVLAARLYGAEAVGNLALVFVFSVVGQFLTSYGTDQNVQVIFASGERNELAAKAAAEIRNRLLRLIFTGIGLGLIYFLLSAFLDDSAAVFYGVLGLAIGAVFACAIPSEIRLIVEQKFKTLVAIKYCSGAVALLIGMVLFFNGMGFSALVSVLALEKFIYLVATISQSNLSSAQRIVESNPLPKYNFHIILNAAAVFAYNRLDQIYIYSIFSSQSLGVYFSTSRLFEIANLVVMAGITSKLHIMADVRRSSEEVLVVERGILLFSFCLALCIAIAAPVILSVVFEIQVEQYAYIYMLAAATLFGLIGAIKAPWVAKNNRFRLNAIFSMAGGVSAIAILTILEPNNLLQVAASVAASQFVVNVFCPMLEKVEREYLLSIVGWRKS